MEVRLRAPCGGGEAWPRESTSQLGTREPGPPLVFHMIFKGKRKISIPKGNGTVYGKSEGIYPLTSVSQGKKNPL